MTPDDEMEEHFLDANERMGEALVKIGMALGLPRPRVGVTWGAPEILARIGAARPVLDAAEKWAEFNGSTNELLAALDAYRAASGSVEADTPAEPGRETNRFGHPVYVGDDWAVEQWSSGEIKVSVSDHRDPPGGQTYYFEPDLAAAVGAAAREVAGTPAAEPAPDAAHLRYVQVRVDDHNDLSDALGIERGSLEWHRLIEQVRALAGAGAPTEPADDTQEGDHG